MTPLDAAWASGLFEGEGCIHSRPEAPISPRLSLAMCDEDVVRRFAAVVGLGTVTGPLRNKSAIGTKPQWRWQVGGFESSQQVIAALWAGLGDRRRENAREVLLAARIPTRSYRREVTRYAA